MRRLIFIIVLFFSTSVFALEDFKYIHCVPDNNVENNQSGGSFSLLIIDEDYTVVKLPNFEYIVDFVKFNNYSIIYELPSGQFAYIDRISGKYKVVNVPDSVFSTAVWQCQKKDLAF